LTSFQKRREMSLGVGAAQALDPTEVGVEFSQQFPNGFDLSFEISGSPKALSQAIQVTGYNGRVVVGSWYGNNQLQLNLGTAFHRSHMQIIASQVSIIRPELAARWSKERRFEAVWDVIRQLKPSKFVTHTIPFQDSPSAYKLLDQTPQDVIQIVFKYQHV